MENAHKAVGREEGCEGAGVLRASIWLWQDKVNLDVATRKNQKGIIRQRRRSQMHDVGLCVSTFATPNLSLTVGLP